MKFVHKVSKGTRFNQIYIPKEMERVFEVGDLVEIKLISKLQFRFHLLLIPENKFFELEKICPLTRNMLFYFVSDKPFEISKETILDKNHIKFLLMMPEDLLEIKSNSRVFYDNLRRIITIEMFLENKTYNLDVIESELKKLFGEALFNYLRNNEPIDDKIITNLREIIKSKLKKIKSKLEEV